MKQMTRFGMAACAATAAVLVSAAPAMAAPGGYGPQVPTGPNGTPGGYSNVVYAHSFGAAGGSVRFLLGSSQVSLDVPAGTFTSPVQAEITSADLTAVGNAVNQLGFAGYHAVAALGVKLLDSNGRPLAGTFAHPITLVLTGPSLGVAGEEVLMFSAANALQQLPSQLGSESVSVQLNEDPDLVVVNPQQPASSALITQGTTTHTGKPFRGELGLAGLMSLTALGLAGTALWRRRVRRQPAS